MLLKSRFVEMFGQITHTDFPIKKLEEICEFIKDGTHQTPTYTQDKINGVKFLSSKDVTSKKIDWTEIKYIPKTLHSELSTRVSPQKGDILLAKNGTTGVAAVVDTDDVFDIYVSLALLRPLPGNNVFYLWSAINSRDSKNQFDSKLKGVGVPNLHLSEIKKTEIIIPPLELQNQYVQFANQLDKLKVILNQIDEKIELLKKSRFVEMFKYVNLSIPQKEWKKISEIGEVIGGSTPKTTEDKYWNGEYKWITPAEISSETHYINDTERHITEEGINSCSLQKLPIGTVLLTSRAPIGKVAIATSEMFCNQGFKNIVCNSQINPEFLYYLLKHNVEYLNSLGRGATFKEISKSIVENIRIPVPSISDQTAFVSFAKQLDKLKVAIHKELELIG